MTRQSTNIDLREYLAVLAERRRVVLGTLVAIVALALVVTFLRTPEYRSTATIQIERVGPEITSYRDIVGFDSAGYHDYYQTQYQVMRSRGVMERAAETLDLSHRPEYVQRRASPLRRALDAVRGRGNERPDPLRRATKFIEDGLDVRPLDRSHLVEISFFDRDPALARDVANAMAGAYQEFNLDLRHQTTSQATEFLTREVIRIRAEITDLEAQLLKYRDSQALLTLGGDAADISEQTLGAVNERVSAARGALAVARARWESVRDAETEALPEVLTSPVIADLKRELAAVERRHAQLSERFKSGWPGLADAENELRQARERLELESAELADRVRRVARMEFERARTELTHLTAQLEAQEREVRRVGHAAIEYASLRDEVETRRSKLTELMARQSESETSEQLRDARTSNVRIVEAALLPLKPARPRVWVSLFVALVLGANAGIGAALLLHHVDNRIKDENQLARVTGGLPSLGHVPLHEPLTDATKPAPDADLTCHDDPRSTFAEAFRSLRTSLLLASPDAAPKRIHVTSSQPGEGKSTITSNLAIVLTQMGRRVLVIDADLRRPRQHKAFGHDNGCGLSNVLTGLASLDEAVQRTTVPGLWLLPSGPIPPNPAELLGSQRFAALLDGLADESDYDHVLIDSPPIVQIADGMILSSCTDVTLLAVRAGVATREGVAAAVERLQRGRATIAGTVLNAVSEQGRYYYHYRYYRSADEQEPPKKTTAAAAARRRLSLVIRAGRRKRAG